jgi:hypothetical protein
MLLGWLRAVVPWIKNDTTRRTNKKIPALDGRRKDATPVDGTGIDVVGVGDPAVDLD